VQHTFLTGSTSGCRNRKPFDNRLITDRATEDRLAAKSALCLSWQVFLRGFRCHFVLYRNISTSCIPLELAQSLVLGNVNRLIIG
jgi:hypothetical protein